MPNAATDERTRIAGELHDVVAHALRAMTVQACAARRLVDADPQRAGAAFAAIEATGRSSAPAFA
jgi:signal transduction histidine kinase